jgi:phosphoribosylanthranilate isomerase
VSASAEPPRQRPHLPQGAVKICGLREPEHALAAVDAGADLLGFIFAPARRQVTAEAAAACVRAARAAANVRRILAVGVFVNASAEEITEAAEIAGLDVLQLHGEEDPALLARLPRPVIKGLRPRPGDGFGLLHSLVTMYDRTEHPPIAYLVDGYHPGHHGGEGVRADWPLVAELARRRPVVLAGGLDAGNVAEAIWRVMPQAVDVSSGVETDGRKDVAKIREFVARAKEGFATRATTEAQSG